jgi:hypothetical protein
MQYKAAGQREQARRRVLEALEDAPRHRAALKLLVELNGEKQ